MIVRVDLGYNQLYISAAQGCIRKTGVNADSQREQKKATKIISTRATTATIGKGARTVTAFEEAKKKVTATAIKTSPPQDGRLQLDGEQNKNTIADSPSPPCETGDDKYWGSYKCDLLSSS